LSISSQFRQRGSQESSLVANLVQKRHSFFLPALTRSSNGVRLDASDKAPGSSRAYIAIFRIVIDNRSTAAYP
jgi:hypothetical protein